MEIINEIIKAFAGFLMEASPFMLLGLFFAGILKAYLPDDIVKKHIGTNKKGGILKASAFGVPIPLCSCGVVPAAAGIRKQGAGKGPVVSFLISTPETGVDSIAITWAMLGPVMAVIRPVAAFFTAVFTGTLVAFFDKESKENIKDIDLSLTSCGCSSSSCSDKDTQRNILPMAGGCGCSSDKKEKDSYFSKFRNGMRFAFIELVDDIALWFMVGVLFAAGIAVFITPEMVNAVSAKSSVLIMGLMLLISIPLYVCATSSTPIAAAFLMTGISPGAALVFLLAGPATNAASFSVISKLIGKRSALIYLAGIIISSLIIGFGADYAFMLAGYELVPSVGNIEEGVTFYIQIVSTIILLLLLIFPIIRKIEDRFKKYNLIDSRH